MSSTFRTYIGLFGVAFFWGTSWAASKIGLQELSPIHLAVFRFILASLIFFCLLKINYKGYVIEKKDKIMLWFLGFLGVVLYFYIQLTGLNLTTTVNSSILIGTSPIFIMFLSTLLFKQEQLTAGKIFGAFIAFIGIFLIFTGGKRISIGGSTLIGDSIMLANSLVWSFFTVLGKDLVDKYDPFVVMAYINIYGTILSLPIAFTPAFISSIKSASLATWCSTLYLAVFCSVYSFYMWYKGVKTIGASRTAMFNYLNPVVAVTIGILFLKEAWNVYTLLGGILVFVGVYAASAKYGSFNRRKRLKKNSQRLKFFDCFFIYQTLI